MLRLRIGVHHAGLQDDRWTLLPQGVLGRVDLSLLGFLLRAGDATNGPTDELLGDHLPGDGPVLPGHCIDGGEATVEAGDDAARRLVVDGGVADVEPFFGPEGEVFLSLASKGRITVSP